MIALDASVAAKWFLPEVGSDAAEQLLEGPEPLVAPDLIRLEVAAAITRKVRHGLLTEQEARQYCQNWFRRLAQDVVALVPEEEILPLAIDLSLQIRHPLQDCLYLAVAHRHGIPLLTADRPFHDRAAPAYAQIRLLPGCEHN